MTTEPNYVKKLQQRNYNLVVENEFFKEQNALLKDANEQLKKKIDTSQVSRSIAENNRLEEICRYWENEHDELKKENEELTQIKETLKQLIDDLNSEVSNLKQQITQHKHKNNKQSKLIDRLITIITDEHYN